MGNKEAGSKLGLSIVDSLDEDMKFSGKVLRSSDSKNILFGPRFRIRTPDGQAYTNSFESPKSLPKNYAIFPHSKSKSPLTKGSSDILFEIGESPLEPDSFGKIRSSSLDSYRTISCMSGVYNSSPNSAPLKFCLENKVTIAQVGSAPQSTGGSPNLNQLSDPKHISIPGSLDSGNGFIGSLSTSGIELYEDYTCVISHGPNPNQQRSGGGFSHKAQHLIEYVNIYSIFLSNVVQKFDYIMVDIDYMSGWDHGAQAYACSIL
ncbi:hypothetical protein UlMin_038311 [Ulmus minor]